MIGVAGAPSAGRAVPHLPGPVPHTLSNTMQPTSRFEMGFCYFYRIPAPLVPWSQPKHASNPDSFNKKINRHLMQCLWLQATRSSACARSTWCSGGACTSTPSSPCYSIIAPLVFKMAQNLDSRYVLASYFYRIPAPLVPAPTCLESRFCNKEFKPHFIRQVRHQWEV